MLFDVASYKVVDCYYKASLVLAESYYETSLVLAESYYETILFLAEIDWFSSSISGPKEYYPS